MSLRRYDVDARSTDTFGRVLCNSRDQHFVVDGPVHNGCPGEALTPAELFLAGVAACGVELIQVIARHERLPVRAVRTAIAGELDPIDRCGRTSPSSTASACASSSRA
jgi:uncharacterized OsmC-like protein